MHHVVLIKLEQRELLKQLQLLCNMLPFNYFSPDCNCTIKFVLAHFIENRFIHVAATVSDRNCAYKTTIRINKASNLPDIVICIVWVSWKKFTLLLDANEFNFKHEPPTSSNLPKHGKTFSFMNSRRHSELKKWKIPHCIPHFNYCDCCVSVGVHIVDMHLNEIRSASKTHAKWINFVFFCLDDRLAFGVCYCFSPDTSPKLCEFSKYGLCFLLLIIWIRLCFKTMRTCFVHQTTSEHLIEKYLPIHSIQRYFIYLICIYSADISLLLYRLATPFHCPSVPFSLCCLPLC